MAKNMTKFITIKLLEEIYRKTGKKLDVMF